MQLQYWRRIEGGMYRLDETACTMRCVFCPTSVEPPSTGAQRRREAVLADLEHILDATPADQKVQLTADDLMAFDGFFDILDAFRRHGRRLELDSPGLRLADRAFVAAVTDYDVHLNVSCQAASDEVYTAMTGNPQAFRLVKAALDNLRRSRISFAVNCVATSINCGSLFAIARLLFGELGLPAFNISLFYPEAYLVERKPDAWKLLPSYRELDKQLARIGVLCTVMDRRVTLHDVAPCQLQSRVVRNPRVFFEFVHTPQFAADSPTARHRTASCDRCVLGERCATVSQRYVDERPDIRFDADRVRRDLAIRERLRPWRC